ncbi:hypothetical protein ZYGR_0S00260 [Zygosaccharomyces rouxii]|uniref:ZYRO0F03058p n=2 Tax=Zygosaccharomyces rouxii TaxID=4956 RepID=C5DX87_ZYGRC|nr:uncharacterized protein ZYRO0F03058g [Zygosaccharomyces rouxii]KAH9199162.1 hypothetical protein LQ764DRAFT_225419 [Zygosaccharomyces rouxii]GAV49894.1 hypothetical protein ZYGR_0S00260 [Zygosaccharomyces rouxii]CAR28398.1 ZYRO0F03058p [Zygosaccharomyces rouxii]
MKLSVVDISKPEEQILEPLLEAATKQGFLLIDGHAFTQSEVDELFTISEGFFTGTGQNEKLKYPIDQRNFGYSGFNVENLNPNKSVDYKEGFNFSQINFADGIVNQTPNYELNQFDSTNPLPPFFSERLDFLSKIIIKLHAQARRIIQLLSMAMGVEDVNFFLKRFEPSKPSPSTFRMLHYPLVRSNSSGKADPHVRAGAHTDYGALTLLFQRKGEQGLQLQLDGCSWTDVEFVPTKHKGMAPPLVINFGDMMSYWTNGVLKSTMHRVRFEPGQTRDSDRYSMVFFFEPTVTTKLIPVPCEMVQTQKGQTVARPEMTSLEYLQKKLESTYSYR